MIYAAKGRFVKGGVKENGLRRSGLEADFGNFGNGFVAEVEDVRLLITIQGGVEPSQLLAILQNMRAYRSALLIAAVGRVAALTRAA